MECICENLTGGRRGMCNIMVCICDILAKGGRCNIMVCIHEILARGSTWLSQICSHENFL